jgi:hypothetical protein
MLLGTSPPASLSMLTGSRSCPLAWSTSLMLRLSLPPAWLISFTHTCWPRLTRSLALPRACLLMLVRCTRPSVLPRKPSSSTKQPNSMMPDTRPRYTCVEGGAEGAESAGCGAGKGVGEAYNRHGEVLNACQAQQHTAGTRQRVAGSRQQARMRQHGAQAGSRQRTLYSSGASMTAGGGGRGGRRLLGAGLLLLLLLRLRRLSLLLLLLLLLLRLRLSLSLSRSLSLPLPLSLSRSLSRPEPLSRSLSLCLLLPCRLLPSRSSSRLLRRFSVLRVSSGAVA